jgi:hypothetical protein
MDNQPARLDLDVAAEPRLPETGLRPSRRQVLIESRKRKGIVVGEEVDDGSWQEKKCRNSGEKALLIGIEGRPGREGKESG